MFLPSLGDPTKLVSLWSVSGILVLWDWKSCAVMEFLRALGVGKSYVSVEFGTPTHNSGCSAAFFFFKQAPCFWDELIGQPWSFLGVYSEIWLSILVLFKTDVNLYCPRFEFPYLDGLYKPNNGACLWAVFGTPFWTLGQFQGLTLVQATLRCTSMSISHELSSGRFVDEHFTTFGYFWYQ